MDSIQSADSDSLLSNCSSQSEADMDVSESERVTGPDPVPGRERERRLPASEEVCGVLLMCLLALGPYLCKHNPCALEPQMLNLSEITPERFAHLDSSFYYWPNSVLPIIGGFLMDRVLGIKWGAVVFAGFIVLGQIIFAVGVLVGEFWLMVVGRTMFAIGGESLAVASYTYIVAW